MKKIVLTITICLTGLLAHGQQRLSYSYDAAGNRTNRTVIVSAQAVSGQENQETTSPVYIDTLDGKELAIRPGKGNASLAVSVKGGTSTSGGRISLIGRGGKILTEQPISGETTIIKLDELSMGTYTMRIFLNRRSSIWKLVKLQTKTCKL
ncbi:hypothetical protein [Sphingobacterium chuzhouense]|uniref:Uncharacterized protein n=1 Tax=Sphingobacterium chuzhouense TaxID=1742264 RepID=A0ABR7XRT0_9SPHI|nr:hypothetical protein [Sphingobacterium chuzhouense]MBD1420992.1 hypothetical protein [Sphingobacterium chuzhouense]